MNNKDLQEFPTRRIKPLDGLAVTAKVWEEAHDYARQLQRFHDLLRHDPGIVAGLQVIASDPPDSSVYVLPGAAVDPRGQMIVVTEPVAYDVGSVHGLVYLLLSYDESQPLPDGDQEDGPLYVHAQFGIEAATAWPDTPCLELARIRRRDRKAPLVDAKGVEHPALNEIDLRFRRAPVPSQIAAQGIASLAVCYTGGLKDAKLGHGADSLARALRRSGHRVWMDDRVPLASGLETYTLVYLVGRDAFQLNRNEMSALYAFLQAGGTVLFESCRSGESSGDPAADASFLDLVASMGIQLEELQRGDDLLVEPHLFATPPPGFEIEGPPKVLVGGGVIFSTGDYGCLWRGERRGRTATREEIRTATEWGTNLIAYAVARQRGTEDQ
jgi:hypothetical protein